jgi:hypothetical protein
MRDEEGTRGGTMGGGTRNDKKAQITDKKGHRKDKEAQELTPPPSIEEFCKDKLWVATLQDRVSKFIFRYDLDNSVASKIGTDYYGKEFELTLDPEGTLTMVLNFKAWDDSVYAVDKKLDHIFDMRVAQARRDWYVWTEFHIPQFPNSLLQLCNSMFCNSVIPCHNSVVPKFRNSAISQFHRSALPEFKIP